MIHSLREMMQTHVIVLNETASVMQAVQVMCEQQVGCILVGNQKGEAVGLVTDRDLLCRASELEDVFQSTLSQVMTRVLVTVEEGADLTQVVQKMERSGVRRIPIVQKKKSGKLKFTGIVTLDDLIAARQVSSTQLANIIHRQLYRRLISLKQWQIHPDRRGFRAHEGRTEESVRRFYNHMNLYLQIPSEKVEQSILLIFSHLIARVPVTAAFHLMAQLPLRLQRKLWRGPLGPDRSYTGKRLIQEYAKQFLVSEAEACGVFSRFIEALAEWMGSDSVSKWMNQLPKEFKPFLKGVRNQEEFRSDVQKTQVKQKSSASSGVREQKPLGQFRSRLEAAQQLANRLKLLKLENPLVLGIPRGSVPMTQLIADQLQGDLDVVLVHKVGAPNNPEFALGSVSELGWVERSSEIQYDERLRNYFDRAAQIEIEKLKMKRKAYSPIHPPVNPKGRVVVLVDDGVATGRTMEAAIRSIRAQKPKRIIVAIPVGAAAALDRIQNEVDELIVLERPREFASISQFYMEFPQVEDAEVMQILSDTSQQKSRAAPRHQKSA